MRSYHLNYGEYPMQFSPVGLLGSGELFIVCSVL